MAAAATVWPGAMSVIWASLRPRPLTVASGS